jgi:hypothetical protein
MKTLATSDLEQQLSKRRLPCYAQISAGKGMSSQAQPLVGWFGSSYQHKWGSLKSAYAAVVGKVGCCIAATSACN